MSLALMIQIMLQGGSRHYIPSLFAVAICCFVLLGACSNGSRQFKRYIALDNSEPATTKSANELSEIRSLTIGPPKRFFEIAAFPTSSPFRQLAKSVYRIDVHYEIDGSIDKTEECTATAIHQDLIITTYHCVPGRPPARASRISIVRDYLSLQDPNARVTEEIPDLQVWDENWDWAIIRHRPLSTDTYLTLKTRPPILGETAFIIGHPLAQPKVLSTGNCRVLELTPESFNHTCATLRGHSGSLVFSASDHAILGIHTRKSGSTNFAYRFDELIDTIQRRGQFSLQTRYLAPPEWQEVNRTGWALNNYDFETAVLQALSEDDSNRAVSTLISQGTGARDPVGDSRLIDLVVESGSSVHLRALAEGEEIGPEELASQLTRAIEFYDDYDHDSTSMVEVLLALGATPEPSSDGLLPQCEVDHRSAIYEVLKKYGHDSRQC